MQTATGWLGKKHPRTKLSQAQRYRA
jgi:hypothetical protein